jgi:threonine/homoserine/homoserine lactone efflux protein
MITSLLAGLLLGLALLFPFALGAASFTILQTSVNKGFYSGMQLAIGIALSDMLLMSLCYFGLVQYIENQTFQLILGLTGSVLLLVYGIYVFRKKNISHQTEKTDIKLKINWMGVFSEIGKGFILNLTNPFLWIFWFSAITSATTGKSQSEALCFMAGLAVMLFSTDLLKSFFANRITSFLSEKTMKITNKIAGIILIISSFALLIRTFWEILFSSNGENFLPLM